MAISEAHKRANQKWDKQNMMTLGVRLKKTDAMAFKAYAAAQGKTANALFKDYVMNCLYPEQERVFYRIRPDANCPEFAQAISVELMRKSDAYTIRHLVPSLALMYRAAMGVFESVAWQGKNIVIVAGSGNNGGDGYALAGILADRGIATTVYQTSEKCSQDGEYYKNEAQSKGVNIVPFTEETNLSACHIVVDCILGTGFQGVPRGMAAAAINAINESGAYVISVDINSGMNGDTGEAVLAVRSDLTVSIGYFKRGLFLGRASELIGEMVNIDIGIELLQEKGE